MTHSPQFPRLPWAALAVAFLALTGLYWDAIHTPFLNDDFLFLEEARTRSLSASLSDLGSLGNYFRPLSRQIYFAVLTPIANGHPLVFHLVNYALFLGALVLVADLLASLMPRAGVLAGTIYFALLPLQRVNLMWVSCSQDLLALAGALGALALHRRDRILPALACAAVAFTSKETALALPLGLAAWDRFVAGRETRDVVRRVAPVTVLALVWTAIAFTMRARHAAAQPLDFHPLAFAAGFAHLFQSLLGLEHPSGFGAALAANGPALLPLVILASLALFYAPRRSGASAETQTAAGTATVPGPVRAEASPGARRGLVTFAVLWLIAFAIPAGPVASGWSSYYYTLAAVGAALLFGLAFSRGDRWTWFALTAGLLWWHAAGSNSQAFAVSERRWVWTSHLTPFYFQRAALLTDSLSRELRRVVPDPEPHTRFFFASLPPWAGFQMGNGALIRSLYRDTTLASHFYSQFSDSTAGELPARFLFWDGRKLISLYEKTRDPWFQVGSDLLLLDRPAGARHAFLRGLSSGGERMDLLYWLGWAELWTGRRDRAEATWTMFGAIDDSLAWRAHLRAAHNSLVERDTLESRRHLISAIEYGMGRPDAHAVLGELIMNSPHSPNLKYGLMELKVAAWLNPKDWWARRQLAAGLARVRLDDASRAELESLVRDHPEAANDTTVARLWNRYRARATQVIEMNGGR